MAAKPFLFETPVVLHGDAGSSSSSSSSSSSGGGSGVAGWSGMAPSTPSAASSAHRTQVESVEAHGSSLFVGTSDGSVLKYSVIVDEDANAAFHRRDADSANTNLLVLDIDTLKPARTSVPIKGVSLVCEDIFSTQARLAISKKKIIQILKYEEKLVAIKELVLNDVPNVISLTGNILCFADSAQYSFANLEANEQIPLFPYDKKAGHPIICNVAADEFLLVVASSNQMAIGVFVTESGDAKRGTINWNSYPSAVGFKFPYVAALFKSTITIHSIVDQQLAQTVHTNRFNAPKSLATSKESLILVPTPGSAMWLRPTPVEIQIDNLLDANRVEEAMLMAEQSAWDGLSDEEKTAKLQVIYQKGGFIYFGESLYDEALLLFQKGHLDPAVLISLFPDISESQSHPELDKFPFKCIDDIVLFSLAKNYSESLDTERSESLKSVLVKSAKEALLRFLMYARGQPNVVETQRLIDSTIIKLLVQLESPSLNEFLAGTNGCDLAECESILLNNKRYHALSRLYHTRGETAKSIRLLLRIVRGELEDKDTLDLEFLLEMLAGEADKEHFFSNMDLVLKRYPEAVRIFFTDKIRFLEPNEVIAFLKAYGESTVRKYVEYLVFQRKIKASPHHLTMAGFLLKDVLSAQGKGNVQTVTIESIADDYYKSPQQTTFSSYVRERIDVLSKARVKLYDFLISFNLNWTNLVELLEKANLYWELSAIYDKLDDVEQALRIHVHKIRDTLSAEELCVRRSSMQTKNDTTDPPLRSILFVKLIGMYLAMEKSERQFATDAVCRILNKYAYDLDLTQVLNLLPETWSISMLSRFLTSSLAKTKHDVMDGQIVCNLTRAENLAVSCDHGELASKNVLVTRTRQCPVCEEFFGSRDVVWVYPNGITIHGRCGINPHICPITKKDFSKNN